VVTETARRIGDAFETAIKRGEITLAQLFDENYREIPGSNPTHYLTDYVALTGRILPAIQDPIHQSDPRIVFCVAWAGAATCRRTIRTIASRRAPTRCGTRPTAATDASSRTVRSRRSR
jgi:hypothetical protein